jgi:hypothetical protein
VKTERYEPIVHTWEKDVVCIKTGSHRSSSPVICPCPKEEHFFQAFLKKGLYRSNPEAGFADIHVALQRGQEEILRR